MVVFSLSSIELSLSHQQLVVQEVAMTSPAFTIVGIHRTANDGGRWGQMADSANVLWQPSGRLTQRYEGHRAER